MGLPEEKWGELPADGIREFCVAGVLIREKMGKKGKMDLELQICFW